MSERPLIVLAPRMLLVRNRLALQTHVLDRFDEGRGDLVVSLEQTHYVDSSGMGMLVGLHRKIVRESAGSLRLCAVNGDLRTLFAVTRLDERLKIVDHVEGERDPWAAPDGWGAEALAALAVAG